MLTSMRPRRCKHNRTPWIVNVASSVLAQLHAEWREKIRRITVVDLSRNMLQKYQEEMHDRKPEMPARRFYVQGDEEFLPLKPASADVIISCLGMHWVNDLPGALRQIRHVLKPDGLFLGAMLGGETLCELRIACLLAEEEVEGGVSPRVSPFARVNDAGSVLTAAGYTLAAVDVDTVMMRYEHPKQLVEHLRDMGETNAQKLRRSYIPKKTLDVSISKYIDQFQEDDGSVPATFEVIFMTGWAPHASQQKPARRGSATVSMKDIDKLTDEEEPSLPSQ